MAAEESDEETSSSSKREQTQARAATHKVSQREGNITQLGVANPDTETIIKTTSEEFFQRELAARVEEPERELAIKEAKRADDHAIQDSKIKMMEMQIMNLSTGARNKERTELEAEATLRANKFSRITQGEIS
ncbi:hypothetical protein SARC_06210 [Sphaeroforma arctica JP610]|uniref:Uncharacterized protein n=1 Tax=Sphaeroforma arctica JP610 TaxID=667725 RepID=A0A0L0FXU2_9EUKA|nr:hypothetical protein SARC_06210 [Sphaeroforma arctica JP610]KNC81464.1 hypothetical protein SARC_06210 [Sphaeroforma arctica JP610]|eukprot:XP_014155366.1 hypothetical protein SARC_06210 [Sphaeroforma arctica JP610]